MLVTKNFKDKILHYEKLLCDSLTVMLNKIDVYVVQNKYLLEISMKKKIRSVYMHRALYYKNMLLERVAEMC